MKRLFLIRHGETDGSAQLRYFGHTDIELNQQGIQQVHDLSERLSHEPIDSIYSSDLRRAFQTAEIIARSSGHRVVRTQALREINLGDWEGLTFEEIRAKDEEMVRRWIVEFETFRMPNGESVPEFKARVEREIDHIIAGNPESNVLVVTHGGVTRIAICYLLGWSLSSFWCLRQDTGCLNIIDFESGKPSLVVLNGRQVNKHITYGT